MSTDKTSFKKCSAGRFKSLTLNLVLAGSCCAASVQACLPAFAASPTDKGMVKINDTGSKSEEASTVQGDETPDGKPYQMNRIVVNARPEDVFDIIVDYKNSNQLFANLTKAQVVSRDEAKNSSNVAFTLKGMLNLWTFDYVLSIKETYPSLIEFRRVSGSFKRNEGYWKLIPLDGGRRTEVVYAKYVDAGMVVPPSLVAKEVRDSTASVVQNLKKVAENPNPKLASHR